MISTIIFFKEFETLCETLKSISNNSKCNEILLLPRDNSTSLSIYTEWLKSCSSCISTKSVHIIQGSLTEIFKKIENPYICITNAGTTLGPSFFDSVLQCWKCLPVPVAFALFETPLEKYIPRYSEGKDNSIWGMIDLSYMPQSIPINSQTVFFERKALENIQFPNILLKDQEILLLYYLLKQTHSYIQLYSSDIQNHIEDYSEYLSSEWYIEFLKYGLKHIVTFYQKSSLSPALPVFLQLFLLYSLKKRFILNINNNNKHAIEGRTDEFFNLVYEMLQYIDGPVLNMSFSNEKFKLTKTLLFTFSAFKCKNNMPIVLTKEQNQILAKQNDIILEHVSSIKANIEVIDFVNGQYIIDGFIDQFMGLDGWKLFAKLNDRILNVEETYRYAHVKFFGVSIYKRYTFRIYIPEILIKTARKSQLRIILSVYGDELILPLKTTRYTSRVCSAIPYSYWKSGDNVLFFSDKSRCLNFIANFSVCAQLKREFHMLVHMFKGKTRSRSMLLFRILYWITHPLFTNKRIWITYEKLYKGGDCGEYLYKYMKQQKGGITAAYVINKDSNDYVRLRKEGYSPLKYGSLKHRLYYVHAEVVFTTHGGVHSFNSFTDRSIMYIQDRLKADVACIQHGLTVQQLAFNSNRLFNNMKRYYCASKYEIENLSKPIYGYEDKTILKLTGIPRYDGLVNQDKKQILITPTWRNYIAMPAGAKNQEKPYFPGFKDTDYFKIYDQLLSDPRIVETAQMTGYKLIYLLHPVISAQIEDFPKHDPIHIIQASTVDYEKILTESSLMVTDYSGIQFDFAYMRKPVIYYHHPQLPPHYKEGGFFYETMGFGEICRSNEEIVKTLCHYMENRCQISDFYKERENAFFAYNDHNSCKRIYEDMKLYQDNKKYNICNK